MDALARIPLTNALCKANLAAGTTTTLTTVSSTSGNLIYAIRGKAYSKADFTNGATPTTDAVTGAAFLPIPANYGSIFVVGLNAAGTMKVVQGDVGALDANGAFYKAPLFGALPDDFCPIGYEVVKCGATYVATTTGWLFGTHNQSSVTGVTYTFDDVVGLTDRPQIA